MSVTICHASIDERGKISGGQAGDQTGREVCTRVYETKDLLARGFKACLVYPDAAIRRAASENAVKLANSGLVGYDQTNRNSLYAELKKNGFDVDKYIKSGVKTETDCSAFMYACYACLVEKMRQDGNAPTTSTMTDFYKGKGFEVKDVTTENFKKGAVLVRPGAHTVMISEAETTASPKTTTVEKTTSKSTGEVYAKCKSGYSSIVDALRSVGETDTSLKHRQALAKANGIKTVENVDMNTKLLVLLKSGKLIKA